MILLYPYFGVSGHGVEVLLDLKRDVLRQHLHRVGGTTDVEAEVFVLDDAQELPVTFLEEELTLLLEDGDVDIAISQVIVTELHNVDRKRQAYHPSQLLYRCWDVVDDASAEYVEYKVAQCALALLTGAFDSSSSILNIVLRIQEVDLTLLGKFYSFGNHAGEAARQIDLHSLQA